MSLDISTPWTIYGPRRMLLTRKQLIDCLGINNDYLKKLIREGRFPPGIRQTAKGPTVWTALDVACYVHGLARGMAPGVEDNGELANEPAE